MTIVKDLSAALRKSVRNFPGTLVGSISAAVFAVLSDAAEALTQVFLRWSLAAAFASLFAFFAGVFCAGLAKSIAGRADLKPLGKELGRRRCFAASQLLQLLSVPLCVLVFFLLKDVGLGDGLVGLRYKLCMSAMFFSSVFLLHFLQREVQVAPNIIVAAVVSGIASTCLLGGLLLIVFAVRLLIYQFSTSIPFYAVVCFTYMVFGVNIFVAYTAREEGNIIIPRPFTLIMGYVLFPLTLVLLVVLYGYFAKCLVTRTMPIGQINPFVSIATAFFFLFYVCLGDKIRFFKKWGSFLFLPLIPLQILAFAIRVNAYGFTELRVASLYYIILSVVFCVLPFVWKGRFMKYSYLLVALFCLLAGFGSFGLYSVTLRSQRDRIVRVFQKYGLYEDGRIRADTQGLLTAEDKAAVVSAYDKLADMAKKLQEHVRGESFLPAWWQTRGEGETRDAHFVRLFGFSWSRGYESGKDAVIRYSFLYSMDTDADGSAAPGRLDISRYGELYSFKINEWYREFELDLAQNESDFWRGSAVISLPAGTADESRMDVDLTEELEALLKEDMGDGKRSESGESPRFLCSRQGYDIYLVSCSLNKTTDGDGTLRLLSYDVSGFACR